MEPKQTVALEEKILNKPGKKDEKLRLPVKFLINDEWKGKSLFKNMLINFHTNAPSSGL